eukprot:15439354-Alexandrium_andersonii.AAC.1
MAVGTFDRRCWRCPETVGVFVWSNGRAQIKQQEETSVARGHGEESGVHSKVLRGSASSTIDAFDWLVITSSLAAAIKYRRIATQLLSIAGRPGVVAVLQLDLSVVC